MNNNKKSIQHLEVDLLQPNPLQPRGAMSPESLDELVASIKEHGVLEPLVVAHTPAGFQIVAGERRWRAAKLAGLKEVPVVVRETSPKGMLEMALVENVQREDLNPLERARAFQRLTEEFNLEVVKIAKRIGKSDSYVVNSLRLLNLPDALKDGLLSGLIAEGHARALLGVGDKSLMIEAYKMILKETGSVRRAEELARRFKKAIEEKKVQKEGGKRPRAMIDETLDKMGRAIEGALPGKSQAEILRSNRQTRVKIFLYGGPKNTEEALQKIYRGICKS